MKTRSMQQLTYREAQKEFVLFLKQHNALKEYKKNICFSKAAQLNMRTYDRFYYAMNPLMIFCGGEILSPRRPTSWIIGAFSWKTTVQGQNYWKNLHTEWLEKMKNVNIINEKT